MTSWEGLASEPRGYPAGKCPNEEWANADFLLQLLARFPWMWAWKEVVHYLKKSTVLEESGLSNQEFPL